MAYQLPRVSVWTGEIPPGSYFDPHGSLDTDGPMSMGFNVIPKNTPSQALVSHLQSNGGLKAYARCLGNRIGTVSNEAIRLINTEMSDQDIARLIESLKHYPNGFIIYDMKHSDAFGNAQIWNAVTENAPGQEGKSLYMALCYDFANTAKILDDYIQGNHARRLRAGYLSEGCVLCTLGMSYFICGSMQKKYSLPNKVPLPRDFGPMYYRGLMTS